MIEQLHKWHQSADEIFFTDSALDTHMSESSKAGVAPFVCFECPQHPAFVSQKALLQHRRIRHNYRDPIVAYVDGSGICPACGTNFQSRLRCLAHLSDTRRTRCRDTILAGSFPTSTVKQLAAREELDRVARRTAQQNGRSHAIASFSAVTASGKKIGHVQS